MRTVLAILVMLLFAGCLATPGAEVDPAADADAAVPPVIEAEGATLQELPGAVHAAWSGTVQIPVATIRGQRIGGEASQTAYHPVSVPAEVRLVRMWLNWSDDAAGLSLRLLDEDGIAWCGVPSDYEAPAECMGTFYDNAERAGDWNVRVGLVGHSEAPSPPVDYTLEAIFSAAPLPMLGLPAPYGEGAPFAFDPIVRVSDDLHSAEPSIALTPEGTIYVAAPTGPQGTLWRSTDDGLTFTPIVIHNTPTDPMSAYPTGGGDSDVAVVGERTIYFTDQQAGQGQTVSASHDGGETWFTNTLAAGPPIGADRQWLVTDGEDTVWLAFNGPSTPAGRATVTKSLDGGRTWPFRTVIDGDRCFRGNLFRDPAGTLYLAGCNADGPGVAVSKDGGLSFTWTNVAKRSGETNTSYFYVGHLFVVGTSDAAGNAYVAWVDPSESGFDTASPDGVQLNVWLASSTDQGATWSEPVRVNQAPGTFVLPWVTAGEEGRVAVSYMATRYVGHPERAMGEWYPVLAVSDDGGRTWRESAMTDQPLQYGPICMRGAACGSARNLLDFFQIQADSSGRVHAALIDGLAGGNYRLSNIMYAHSATPLLGGASVDKSGGVHAATPGILPLR